MRFSKLSLGVTGMRPPPLPKILSSDDCTLSVWIFEQPVSLICVNTRVSRSAENHFCCHSIEYWFELLQLVAK